jgi:hypothetical protein
VLALRSQSADLLYANHKREAVTPATNIRLIESTKALSVFVSCTDYEEQQDESDEANGQQASSSSSSIASRSMTSGGNQLKLIRSIETNRSANFLPTACCRQTSQTAAAAATRRPTYTRHIDTARVPASFVEQPEVDFQLSAYINGA